MQAHAAARSPISPPPDRPGVLREWHCVLRPCGRVLFTDALVITGAVTNEEIRLRSSIGFFLFSVPFRRELLRQAMECLLAGDLDVGKSILRDYINATMGFERLGALTHKSPKSLMRMFGRSGNPHARNLLEVIVHLQRAEKLRFTVRLTRAS